MSFRKAIVLISLFFAGAAPALSQDRDYFPPQAAPDRIMLNLTATPARSMAVTWRTALFVNKGYVQLSKADPSPYLEDSLKTKVVKAEKTAFLSDQNGSNYYSAVLEGLEPETLYAYRVGDSTHWSEWAHFRTAIDQEAPLSFIYFGDAQNDIKSLWSRTIRGAFQQLPKADFLLHAGDLINRSNRDLEWGEWFYAGGWIYSMIPSVATPGNHEYAKDEKGVSKLNAHWKTNFTLPENGPQDLGETAYYIDYQGTRIISIDSPAFLRSKEEREAQIAWLKTVLENNPQKWTIVTMHHPVYSTAFGRDNKELRAGLQPVFEAYKVDLVLQGHDHTYGRGTNLPIGQKGPGTLEGPMYVVSVSGPKMYNLGFDEWMQRGASNTQLYQLIHINGDKLRFEAYSVDNQLYDAFELKKNLKTKTNIFTDLAPANVPERLDLPPGYLERMKPEELEKFKAKFEAYKKRKMGKGK